MKIDISEAQARLIKQLVVITPIEAPLTDLVCDLLYKIAQLEGKNDADSINES